MGPGMIGRTIANYTILNGIGSVGMGEVYLANDRRMDRRVAIKFLPNRLSTSAELVDRFFAEARALSLSKHPGIAEIHDCGVVDDRAYIVIEYFEGESLSSIIARTGGCRSEASSVAAVAGHVAAALAAAHAQGTIHRSLNPENILLSEPGDAQAPFRCKVVDFGVARLVTQSVGLTSLTQAVGVLGPPRCMSPEQCRGIVDIDGRSDVYALGCIFFELFSGRRVFECDALEDIVAAHIAEPAPALSSVITEVPPQLDSLVATMLAKRPDDRPSMGAVLAKLEAFLNVPAEAFLGLVPATTVMMPMPLFRRSKEPAPVMPSVPARDTTQRQEGAPAARLPMSSAVLDAGPDDAAEPLPSRPSMIGQAIGSYRIVSKLGEGGMGAVYLGEHLRIARKAAIKVLLPELSANQQIVARLFNEARATSLIEHPGIVQILDSDVLPGGSAFIVMEHLVGESLRAYLRRGERLSMHRALRLARNVADALAAAHDKGIVHRDLKPDNVFLLATGDQSIKILDFGIAKLTDTSSGEGSYKTRTGVLLGTPVYMSPEQCRGTGEVDLRTDIYSLGCMLFEMLSGRPPFTSKGFGELIQSHLSLPPPELRSINSSLPPRLEGLVASMLAKPPAARPQTMRALVAELDAAIAAIPETDSAAALPAVSADSAKASQQIATAVFPDLPVHTTLRSASSERVDRGPDEAPIATGRRRGRLIASLLAAGAIGAVGIWLAAGPRPPTKPGSHTGHGAVQTPNAARTTPNPPEVAPVVLASPPTQRPQPEAPHEPVVVATPAAPKREAPPPPNGPGAFRRASTSAESGATVKHVSKVKVTIASEPPGADVCLVSDRNLLGTTDFDWNPRKASTAVKVLIRKRGYRGLEIAVDTDRDSARRVKLHKLGPDDIDDIDNCRHR